MECIRCDPGNIHWGGSYDRRRLCDKCKNDLNKINQRAFLRKIVLKRDNGVCQECFGKEDEKNGWPYRKEVHHIMPISRGGEDHPNNLITLCWICHRLKGKHKKS